MVSYLCCMVCLLAFLVYQNNGISTGFRQLVCPDHRCDINCTSTLYNFSHCYPTTTRQSVIVSSCVASKIDRVPPHLNLRIFNSLNCTGVNQTQRQAVGVCYWRNGTFAEILCNDTDDSMVAEGRDFSVREFLL